MSLQGIEELLTIILLLVGAFFMIVGSVGILKMPDLFMRMSATTKSSTMGIICTLLAAVVHFFDDVGTATRILATIVFVLLTVPIAAHMIGRAGYFSGAKLWEMTIADELQGRYDKVQDILTSKPPTSRSNRSRTSEISKIHDPEDK